MVRVNLSKLKDGANSDGQFGLAGAKGNTGGKVNLVCKWAGQMQ